MFKKHKWVYIGVAVTLMLMAILACGLSDNLSGTEEPDRPSYVPDAFEEVDIPVFVCDSDPFTNEDAECWQVVK